MIAAIEVARLQRLERAPTAEPHAMVRLLARVIGVGMIWSMTKRNRARSRRSSAKVLGGNETPSGVQSAFTRSGAVRRVGLKFRMPKRTRHAFIRLHRNGGYAGA